MRAYLQQAAYRSLSDEAYEVYMEPWRGEGGQTAFYRQIAQLDQCYTDEVEELYEPLDCPVTILWGEEDNWIPVERGETLASRLTDRNLIRVPSAGHLLQDDAPEVLVATMFKIE